MNSELKKIRSELDAVLAGADASQRKAREQLSGMRSQLQDLKQKRAAAMAKDDDETYYKLDFEIQKLSKEVDRREQNMRGSISSRISEKQYSEFEGRLRTCTDELTKKTASSVLRLWEKITGSVKDYNADADEINGLYREIRRAARKDTSVWDVLAYTAGFDRISHSIGISELLFLKEKAEEDPEDILP